MYKIKIMILLKYQNIVVLIIQSGWSGVFKKGEHKGKKCSLKLYIEVTLVLCHMIYFLAK